MDDKRLDRIEQKIDKVVEGLSTHNTSDAAFHAGTIQRLDRYNDQLEIHLKRTELLEKRFTTVETRLEPLEHVLWLWNGFLVVVPAGVVVWKLFF